MRRGFHLAKKSNKSTFARGRPVTQLQKEMLIQAYALCGNKSQVAREVGCSVGTVSNVVKEAETDKTLQKARITALESVAGQLHGKTVDIIQSIGPVDLESGLIKTYADKDDPTKLTGVRAYGPSLLQKVTSAAIFTDKLKVVEETKQCIMRDQAEGSNELMLPSTVQGALQLLGKKIKRIKFIDVQFNSKHEDTVSRCQDVAHRAELNPNVDEADFEEIDFDNPE